MMRLMTYLNTFQECFEGWPPLIHYIQIICLRITRVTTERKKYFKRGRIVSIDHQEGFYNKRKYFNYFTCVYKHVERKKRTPNIIPFGLILKFVNCF